MPAADSVWVASARLKAVRAAAAAVRAVRGMAARVEWAVQEAARFIKIRAAVRLCATIAHVQWCPDRTRIGARRGSHCRVSYSSRRDATLKRRFTSLNRIPIPPDARITPTNALLLHSRDFLKPARESSPRTWALCLRRRKMSGDLWDICIRLRHYPLVSLRTTGRYDLVGSPKNATTAFQGLAWPLHDPRRKAFCTQSGEGTKR